MGMYTLALIFCSILPIKSASQLFVSQYQPIQNKIITRTSIKTFSITSDNTFSYFILSLKQISKENAKIALIENYQTAPYLQGNELVYSEMDLDGFAQQNGKHSITIQDIGEKVFVTVVSNTTIDFSIQLKGTYMKECLGECSLQGTCILGECYCSDGVIGRDCSTSATQIQVGEQLAITFYEKVSYFYYEYYQFATMKQLQLQIKTTSIDDIYIAAIQPGIVSLPTQQFSDINATINQNQDFSMQFQYGDSSDSSDDFTDYINDIIDSTQQKRLLFAIWAPKNSSCNIYLTTVNQKNKSEQMKVITIVLSSVGGFIVLIFIAFLIYKIRQRQRGKLTQELTPDRRSIANDIEKFQLEPNDNIKSGVDCAICLTSLSIGAINTTICRHTFHSACISSWLKVSPDCPNCRTKLKQPK